MHDSGVEVRWLGASSIEIDAQGAVVAIDPHAHAVGDRGDIVCLTREDHDHFDPVALRRLAEHDPIFVVPKSCTLMHLLDAPLVEPDTELTSLLPEERTVVLHPRYARSPKAGVDLGIEVAGFRVEPVQSSDREPVSILDRWQRYRSTDWEEWPTHDGGFVGLGELGPQGYLVTHIVSGASVYHPGDLQEVFDFHYDELRGRVDLLLLPVGPLGGVELSLVEAVRPRLVVPIHYRPAGSVVPGPDAGDYPAVDLGTGYPTPEADPSRYRREYRSLINLRWYPSPPQPTARIEGLKDELAALGSQLIVADAGAPIPLP